MLNSIKLSVPLLAFVDCLNSPHTPLGSIISHRSSHILCSKNACVRERSSSTKYRLFDSQIEARFLPSKVQWQFFNVSSTYRERRFIWKAVASANGFFLATCLIVHYLMFDSQKNASAIAMFPCRSTFPSSGRYAGHCFAADSTGWAGLRGSIIAAQEFNLFGIPYVGSYICGDNSTLDDVELCVRWYQLGAFYSLSRCSRLFLTHLHKKSSWRSRTTREDLFHLKRNCLITLD